MTFQQRIPALILMAATVMLGCDPPSSSQSPVVSHNESAAEEEHEHPESLAEAVTQLVALRNTIRDGFAAGDIDTAHGPLHDVGHLLEDVSALAAKEKMSEEELASITQQVERLLDAFGAVDKTLHGGDGSTYEEESETIDAAVKILADLAQVDNVGPEPEISADAVPPASTDVLPAPDTVEPEPVDAPLEAPAPKS